MTPERWLQVKSVLHEAMERPVADRAAFLDEACRSDARLRREVESLLHSAELVDATDFLEQPPAVVRRLATAEQPNESMLMSQLSAALGVGYIVERELGGGGMSRVFVAFERAFDRHVAVKVLSPELAHRVSAERFGREVRVAARLQQANIVPVHTAGEVGGLAYYIMPYAGESLRERLLSGSVAPAAGALGILKDIAKALAYAHHKGVVHRDIKPENVLLSGGTAVVTDFGIAKAISVARAGGGDQSLGETSITSEGIALGTPAYMAPEQAAGDRDVGPRADVYSFGMVAYELLAGVHPFAAKRGFAELMAAQVLETPRDITAVRQELPLPLSALVMRCLAKDPSQRFADGAELLTALENVELSPLGRIAAATAHADVPSVAVLPLENLSADPENEYFSDGIAAEVLSVLTRVRGPSDVLVRVQGSGGRVADSGGAARRPECARGARATDRQPRPHRCLAHPR